MTSATHHSVYCLLRERLRDGPAGPSMLSVLFLIYTEFQITGCEELDAKELFQRHRKTLVFWWSLYTLRVEATFTETSTGVKREEQATSSRMKWDSKTLSFSGLSDTFKPGFPFKFNVSISAVFQLVMSCDK